MAIRQQGFAMLELRPNCELCDRDLPPDSPEARICSYECTFCQDCVNTQLHDVCPNCGGGFCVRPVRPSVSYRPNVGLQHHPPSTARVHSRFSRSEVAEFSRTLKATPPEQR